jgi:hypothetical protein
VAERNPLEELVNEMAEVYPEIVREILEELAPSQPWYSQKLTTEEQLLRWLELRNTVLPWIYQAARYMGALEGLELAYTEAIFTTQEAEVLIPPDHQRAIPLELLMMVQSVGPKETARHIQKMEAKLAQLLDESGLLAGYVAGILAQEMQYIDRERRAQELRQRLAAYVSQGETSAPM